MTKSNSKSLSGQKDPSPTVFINYDLTKEDKAQILKMKPEGEEVLAEIDALLREGYGVTLKWDDYSDCPSVYLIPKSEKLPNFGAILTSRASTVFKAMVALLYKHRNVYAGLWRDRVAEAKATDDW